MELRPLRLALVLAGAAVLAACTGATGTVEDDAQTDSQTASDATTTEATTSGTGDDTVSATGGAVARHHRDRRRRNRDAGEFGGHPLDDPAGSLATRTIYFAFDSSEVPGIGSGPHRGALALSRGATRRLITLEGHADERGSREYNIALGERRAHAVRQLMTLLGATNPPDPHHPATAKSAPRRSGTTNPRGSSIVGSRSSIGSVNESSADSSAGWILRYASYMPPAHSRRRPSSTRVTSTSGSSGLERLLGSEALVKLFEEVESMAIEIRDLRGQLEVQTHTINQLKQRQRELYLDVDQRLQRVESAGTTQVAGQQPTGTTAGTQTGSTVSAVGQSDSSTTQAPTAATQAATGVDPFAEQQAYQSAFELLKSGRYEDARGRVHPVHRGLSDRKLRGQCAVLAGRDVLHHTAVRRGDTGVRTPHLAASGQPEAHARSAESRIRPRRARPRGGGRAGAGRPHCTLSAVGGGRPCAKAARGHPPVTDPQARSRAGRASRQPEWCDAAARVPPIQSLGGRDSTHGTEPWPTPSAPGSSAISPTPR